MFTHVGEIKRKWPKNAQNGLKGSEIAVFRLLVNEDSMKIHRLLAGKNLLIVRAKK